MKAFGLTYFGMTDRRQGIVHVIGPEEGFTVRFIAMMSDISLTHTVIAPWDHLRLWRLAHI